MDEVVQKYWTLRKLAQDSSQNVSASFGLNPDQGPVSFFNMAFNATTMTIELLSFYKKVWEAQTETVCSSVEEAREQNAQRVIMFQKLSFIEIMSTLEFAAKNLVIARRQKFGVFAGRVYLSSIMARSAKIRIIDAASLNLWTGAIRIRNALVHHNGISEETASYQYPGFVINVTANQMMQGNLHMFGNLVEWVLINSDAWMRAAYK